MPFKTELDEAPVRLRRQALQDVDRRAVVGIPAYLAAWLAVVAGDARLREELGVVIVISVLTAAFALGRLLLHRRFATLVVEREVLARRLLRGLLLGNAALVGLIGVLSLWWTPLTGSRELLLVVGGVICTSATMALAMDPVMRIGMPLAVLAPYCVGLLARWDPQDLPLVGLILLFGAYLHRAAGHVHDDWWGAANSLLGQRRRAAELELLSITDGLTGLANRVYFDNRLEETWAQATRSGSVISVLLIDLDHFKAINDTFGHSCGDACLAAAAGAIQHSVQRRSDLVARHGGEEFTVLLPETGAPAAAALAERVRAAIQDVRVLHDGDPIPLSASIGVATLAPLRTNAPARALVEAADAALYAAKRAGRNRVQTAAA